MPITTSPRVLARVRRALLASVIALAMPSVASAHLGLRSSAPADGATLSTPPSELRLQFTQAVRLSAVRVTLRVGAMTLDSMSTLALDPADPTTVVVTFIRRLAPGSYAADWRVVGADGHPVTGRVSFTVEGATDSATVPALSAPDDEHLHHEESAPAVATSAATLDPLGAVTRTLGFGALLLALGAAAVGLRIGDRDDVARLGAWASAALLLHALLRLPVQLIHLEMPIAALASWRELTLGGAWASGWWLQIATASLAWLGFARRQRAVALAAVAAAAFVPALSGHAVAQSGLAVLVDGLHVAGAGAWLGSLAVLAVTMLRRGSGAAGTATDVATALRRFSPIALGGATAVVASGAISSWLRVGALPTNLGDPYVRALLAKLLVVGLVAAVGAYNWRRVLPQLESPDGAARLRRTATLELALGLLVLVVTALLVVLPAPALTAAN